MSSTTNPSTTMPTNHIVFVPVSSRSHIRILLQLSLNCLVLHPSLIATILVPQIYTERIDEELALQPPALLERMRDRFRVVKIDDGLTAIGGFGMENQVFAQKSPPVVEALIRGQVGDGRWTTRPCAFVGDTFRVSLWAVVRNALDKLGLAPIPIVQFIPTFGLSMHRYISPDEEGGMCEKIKQRYELNLAHGLEEKEAAKKAMRFIEDRLLEWPDLPPMYDYEWTPQAESRVFSAIMITVMSIAFDHDRVKDGIICVSIPELDSASLKRLAQIAGADVFGVGPQFNEHVWKAAVAAEENKSGQAKEEDAHIIEFLDKAYSEHGENSAAYLSLGTAFWPTTRPDIIETIVDSLLELETPIPFVFATANSDGKLPDALKQKIHDSGRGLVTDWAPQVKVLQHPATGIFLTHCGVGSLTEAIVCGVPILTMPFAADQPGLSAHFTQITPIGRQLNQLASGLAGRTTGTGVHVPGTKEAMLAELAQSWKDMRGEPGVRYRAKTAEVREVLRKSWEDGGSRQAVMGLSRFFTDVGE